MPASVADAGAVLAANGAAPRAEAGLAEVAAALRRIDGRIAALSGIGAAVVTAGVLGAGVATLTATGAINNIEIQANLVNATSLGGDLSAPRKLLWQVAIASAT